MAGLAARGRSCRGAVAGGAAVGSRRGAESKNGRSNTESAEEAESAESAKDAEDAEDAE